VALTLQLFLTLPVRLTFGPVFRDAFPCFISPATFFFSSFSSAEPTDRLSRLRSACFLFAEYMERDGNCARQS
jgi:hypothetical protein